jgi:hypothetical protein
MITFHPRLKPFFPDDNILSQMITLAQDESISSQMITFSPK